MFQIFPVFLATHAASHGISEKEMKKNLGFVGFCSIKPRFLLLICHELLPYVAQKTEKN